MKNDRFFVTYLIFLLLFFYSAAVRFESEFLLIREVQKDSPSPFLFAFLASLFLMFSLRSIFRVSVFLLGAVSATVTIALFIGGTYLEDQALHRHWSDNQSEQSFSRIEGHCYPKVGRAAIRYLDRVLRSKSEAKLREIRIDSACRLRHFRSISEHGRSHCLKNESASKCTLRWASVFGRSGAWDYSTRDYFFERMLDSWMRDRDAESLVSYVIRDHELSDLKSIDVETEEDESLSKKIYEKVGELIRQASTARPEPYHLKFKEYYSEFLARSGKSPGEKMNHE